MRCRGAGGHGRRDAAVLGAGLCGMLVFVSWPLFGRLAAIAAGLLAGLTAPFLSIESILRADMLFGVLITVVAGLLARPCSTSPARAVAARDRACDRLRGLRQAGRARSRARAAACARAGDPLVAVTLLGSDASSWSSGC